MSNVFLFKKTYIMLSPAAVAATKFKHPKYYSSWLRPVRWAAPYFLCFTRSKAAASSLHISYRYPSYTDYDFQDAKSPALSERHHAPDLFNEPPLFPEINASADLPIFSFMKSNVLPSKPLPERLFVLCFLPGRLQLLQIALEPRELCCSEILFFAGCWALLTDFKRNSLFTNRLL